MNLYNSQSQSQIRGLRNCRAKLSLFNSKNLIKILLFKRILTKPKLKPFKELAVEKGEQDIIKRNS